MQHYTTRDIDPLTVHMIENVSIFNIIALKPISIQNHTKPLCEAAITGRYKYTTLVQNTVSAI